MTTYSAEIRDDISHSEGGHALIVFGGLQVIPQDLSLCIEAIDPALGLGVLRPDAPVAAKLTDKGVEIAVGPEIADRIEAGTAVSITLCREANAEALWPSLMPWMAPRRRPGRVNQPPARTVVTKAAPKLGGTAPVAVNPKPVATRGGIDATPPVEVKRPPDGVPIDVTGPPEPQNAAPPPISTDVKEQAKPAKIEVPLKPVQRKGVAAWIAALSVCVAFTAGAGLMTALNGGRGAPSPLPPDFKPASPYDALSALPKTSPRGQAVNLEDQQQFLARGLALRSSDNEESEFWLKWAARSALAQVSTSAALSALGVVIVRGHETPSNVATARVLWAMAALSGDCDAIRNLATSHAGADGVALDAEDAATWRDPARHGNCPGNN